MARGFTGASRNNRASGRGRGRPRNPENVVLPHAWTPHPWQQRVLDAFKAGKKRFLLVVHRRAGKDQVGLNVAAIASQMKTGLYWHIFPTETGNRGAIWEGMDKNTGIRFIDQAFPEDLRERVRDNRMEIVFKNGSMWKAIGSDNYNALRGGNPIGVVFSEFAFADPASWTSIVAPVLRENGGWAMFISTPNGKNHFHDLYENARANPDIWHVEYLTVTDTQRADGTPLLTEQDMKAAITEDGMSEADIKREFYCDWSAVYTGSYYGKEVESMKKEGRIASVPYDPKRQVYCTWDLGTKDLLVALFWQQKGSAHYLIASRAWQFTNFEDALEQIAVDFPWKVSKHLIPHDAADSSMINVLIGALEKYAETAVLPVTPVIHGIQAVRSIFPTMWIDNQKHSWGDNDRVIEAISGYRTTQNPKQKQRGVFSATPLHSWESHYADALRYYAVGVKAGSFDHVEAWGPAPDYALQDKAQR